MIFLAYACREMLLPDLGMIHGRLIVAAWSFGLDDVTDNASKMLLHAVEVHISPNSHENGCISNN